jgi:hypothetical protein
MIDTGDSGWPLLKHSYATQHGLAGGPGPQLSTTTAGDETSNLHLQCLRKFALKDWILFFIPAYVNDVDTGVDRWPDFDGLLGYEFLKRTRITLDFARRLVYVTPLVPSRTVVSRGCS